MQIKSLVKVRNLCMLFLFICLLLLYLCIYLSQHMYIDVLIILRAFPKVLPEYPYLVAFIK